MLAQEQYDVWCTEVANRLIEKYQYRLIAIEKGGREMWLVNPKMDVAPIMMVSPLPIKDFNLRIIQEQRQTLALVFNIEPKGLNISVFDDAQDTTAENVVLTPHIKTPSPILDVFQDLQSGLSPEGNLEQSRNRALKNLNRNMQRRQKVSAKTMPGTLAVFGVITLIYLAAIVLQFMGYSGNVVALLLGGFYKPYIVMGFEYWRFLTAGFLHINFLHYLMNAVALLSLGAAIEPRIRTKRFVFALLAGIVFGNIFAFVTDQGMIGLGLSGGLYALLGIYTIYLFENGSIRNRQVQVQLFSLIVINLLISLSPGVSIAAHLGGLQIGVFLGILYSKRNDWQKLRNLTKGILVLAIVSFVWIMSTRMVAIPDAILNQEYFEALRQLGLDAYVNHLKGLGI